MNKSFGLIIKSALFVFILSLFSCYSNVEQHLGNYYGVLVMDYNVGGPDSTYTTVKVDKGSQPQSIDIFGLTIVVGEDGKGHAYIEPLGFSDGLTTVEFINDSISFFRDRNMSPSSGYDIYFNGKKQ